MSEHGTRSPARRQRRSSAGGVVVGVVVLATSLLGLPARAAPTDPGPPPAPLVAGPWPPSRVLAADPTTVDAPLTASAAVDDCPAAPYGVRNTAPGSGRTVALTFDDGPGASTDAILAILRQQGVTATFFDIGVNETVRPETVRRARDQGVLLANHTWSHPNLTTATAAEQAAQMDRASAQQASVTGRYPCFFRPPYGAYDSTTLRLAQERRMVVVNWSVDTEDWKAAGSADRYWVDRITTRAQAGASQAHPVILLHNQPQAMPATVAALPSIIAFYKARGYTFVDLAGRVADRPPLGALDSARADASGAVTVRGWTIDPDTPTTPTRVHVYVDGRGAASVVADLPRPDVGRAHPWAGALHGFDTAVRAGPGAHSVCLYAIDTSGRGHTRLGCRTVTVPSGG